MEQQPERKIPEESLHNKVIRYMLSLLGIGGISLMIVIAAIVGSTDDECNDDPLKEWLIILAIFLPFPSLALIIVEIFFYRSLIRPFYRNLYYLFLIISLFVIFIWMAIGCYFLRDDYSCLIKYEDGYDLSLSLFVIFFMFGAFMIAILALGILFKAFEDKQHYEELP
ncbi:unnamed protein product [Blepharisma stoltei]|uniref:MARVEL domain-containing protein n=1 Tax=Blepharisma stoltei TaxID=1481888 RepID=A0AAU9IYB6_9CILI|nr:unnamed protein product [Blepharisma stoltei]